MLRSRKTSNRLLGTIVKALLIGCVGVGVILLAGCSNTQSPSQAPSGSVTESGQVSEATAREARAALRNAGIRCTPSTAYDMGPGLACEAEGKSVQVVFDAALLCQKVEEIGADGDVVPLIVGQGWMIIGETPAIAPADAEVAAALGDCKRRTIGEFCADR